MFLNSRPLTRSKANASIFLKARNENSLWFANKWRGWNVITEECRWERRPAVSVRAARDEDVLSIVSYFCIAMATPCVRLWSKYVHSISCVCPEHLSKYISKLTVTLISQGNVHCVRLVNHLQRREPKHPRRMYYPHVKNCVLLYNKMACQNVSHIYLKRISTFFRFCWKHFTGFRSFIFTKWSCIHSRFAFHVLILAWIAVTVHLYMVRFFYVVSFYVFLQYNNVVPIVSLVCMVARKMCFLVTSISPKLTFLKDNHLSSFQFVGITLAINSAFWYQ